MLMKGYAADINGDALMDDDDFTRFVLQYNAPLCADPATPDACSASYSILAPAYDVMVF